MNIFGIGPLEILLVLLLVILVLGPKDIQKTSKMIGRSLNKLVRSDTWKTVVQTTQEIRKLPNKLMREANLDDLKETVEQMNKDVVSKTENKIMFEDWSSPPTAKRPAGEDEQPQENSIAPPETESKSLE